MKREDLSEQYVRKAIKAIGTFATNIPVIMMDCIVLLYSSELFSNSKLISQNTVTHFGVSGASSSVLEAALRYSEYMYQYLYRYVEKYVSAL